MDPMTVTIRFKTWQRADKGVWTAQAYNLRGALEGGVGSFKMGFAVQFNRSL